MSKDIDMNWQGERGEQWRAHLDPMEAMLAPIDAPLIKALDLTGAKHIADIGCGGGQTSRSIRSAASPEAKIHGFDISKALIDAAKETQSANLSFSLANVEKAPIPSLDFDRLVSRFGIMFFEQPGAAFKRLMRWLNPDGKFAFAVWASPSDNTWIRSVKEAVEQAVAVPKPDRTAPGPFRYADADILIDLLQHAGARDIAVHDWRGTLPFGGGMGVDDAVAFALSAFGMADPLRDASADKRRIAERALTKTYTEHLENDIVVLSARVSIVTGNR